MKETKITLPKKGKWIELKLEGNFNCPSCNSILIVMNGINLEPYAFCTKCNKYWIWDNA